jgi:DNA-binding transcriptional ArsR family regulator
MNQSNISLVAHLIAEPVRSVILITLMDGSARSASSLAEAASITAQTASSHLSKLVGGGLLRVERKGRHRYYRLADPHVSHVLESLASVGPVPEAWRNPSNRSAKQLRFARCCYDHLAGQIGVAITQSMLARNLIVERTEPGYALTHKGADCLHRVGMEIADLQFDDPGCARRCLDWTERQYHVAGPLGARLMQTCYAQGWMRRSEGTRAVAVTPVGWLALKEHFGIEPEYDHLGCAARERAKGDGGSYA